MLGGESGSADTARDPRGFAMKFYTDEGNWDLVGNNTPIFFIRDPIFVSQLVFEPSISFNLLLLFFYNSSGLVTTVICYAIITNSKILCIHNGKCNRVLINL